MLIINQDRDQQHIYNPTVDTIQVIAIYHQTYYMGTNLYLHGELLGTFDSHQEAINERDRIVIYPHEIYVVSGYSLWREWNELSGMMAGGDCNEND